MLRAALRPLAERDFRLLLLGRTVSPFGTAFAPIALAFAVLDLGGSATDLGLVVAASTFPMVVFILVGGIWADRLPRHRVAATALVLLIDEVRNLRRRPVDVADAVSA